MNTDDIEDYLDTMHSIASGKLTEINMQRAGDVQAFRDAAAEQMEHGVQIYLLEDES